MMRAKTPMRRAKFWDMLAAVWLVACEALLACRAWWPSPMGWPSPARAGKRRPTVGPGGMVWRPATTGVGRETGLLQERRTRRLGRRGRAPNETALPGGPLAAGTHHPSLPYKFGNVHICLSLYVSTPGRPPVQTAARDGLGTKRAAESLDSWGEIPGDIPNPCRRMGTTRTLPQPDLPGESFCGPAVPLAGRPQTSEEWRVGSWKRGVG
jgi:hypothetical protein